MFHISSVFKNIIDNRYFLKCYNVIFFKLLKKKKKTLKTKPLCICYNGNKIDYLITVEFDVLEAGRMGK